MKSKTSVNDDYRESDDSDISLSGHAIALAITDNDSLASALAGSGMEMRDFIVLSFVSDQGSITAGLLARLVGLDIEETKRSIGKLIEIGLLYGDMSVVEAEQNVVATDAGQAVAAKILSVM